MITNFFKGCYTLEDVKAQFRKLALEHHPDKGGDVTTMQTINAQYSKIKKDIESGIYTPPPDTSGFDTFWEAFTKSKTKKNNSKPKTTDEFFEYYKNTPNKKGKNKNSKYGDIKDHPKFF